VSRWRSTRRATKHNNNQHNNNRRRERERDTNRWDQLGGAHYDGAQLLNRREIHTQHSRFSPCAAKGGETPRDRRAEDHLDDVPLSCAVHSLLTHPAQTIERLQITKRKRRPHREFESSRERAPACASRPRTERLPGGRCRSALREQCSQW
jgi:hypothetical protein